MKPEDAKRMAKTQRRTNLPYIYFEKGQWRFHRADAVYWTYFDEQALLYCKRMNGAL